MSQWNFVIQHPDGSETRIYGEYYYQDYDGKWKYSPVPSTQEERLRLLRGRRNPNNNGMTYWFDCPLYVADTKDAVVAIVNANRPATPVPTPAVMSMAGGGIPQIASVPQPPPVHVPVVTGISGQIDYDIVEKYRDQRLSVAKINALCKACNLNWTFTSIRKRRNRGYHVCGYYDYLVDGIRRQNNFMTDVSGESGISCINFLNKFLDRHIDSDLYRTDYAWVRFAIGYNGNPTAIFKQIVLTEIKNYLDTFYNFHPCIRNSMMWRTTNNSYNPFIWISDYNDFIGHRDSVYNSLKLKYDVKTGKYINIQFNQLLDGKAHEIIESFHREKNTLDNWLNGYVAEISKK